MALLLIATKHPFIAINSSATFFYGVEHSPSDRSTMQNGDTYVHDSNKIKTINVEGETSAADPSWGATYTARPTNTSVNYIIKMFKTAVPVEVKGDGGNNYSTEERVIGTWIDGKPIYRKVFEVTSPSAGGTSVTIVTGALANAYMVGLRCVLHRSNPKGDFEAGSVNATTEYIKVWVKDNDIRMAVSDDFINSPASIVVEYTKTTD